MRMDNVGFVDRWSLLHFLSGAVLRLLGFSQRGAILALVLFEFLERPIFQTQKESLINQVGDVAVGMAGYKLVG